MKLSLHWAHEVWPSIPTLASLVVVVGILPLTTVTSLLVTRDQRVEEESQPVS